ncbi:hypothetical protein [Catenulispora subtropica]|uniref:LigA n=1 Tax=Catenulispora subtropica TaxID=450798 RepID=A0ABP5EIU1_9ACTN
MSAQDDVLAAFGEPRKRVVAAEETAAEETAAEVEEAVTEAGVTEAEGAETAVAETVAAEEQPEEQRVGTTPYEDAAAESEKLEREVEPAEEPGTEADSSPEPVLPAPVQAVAAAPEQLYLDPSAFFTQLQAESAPKPKPRWPRLLLRYASALVLAGAVGAGTAYAVTLPQRTDVPFLATPNDGRAVFPVITKPAPPAGKPAPGDESNGGQVHYGDLRRYLLPVPKGAVLKEDGWEPAKDFAAGMDGAVLAGRLNDAGLRRIAWRGWVAKDGQHTVVELFQFADHAGAFAMEGDLESAEPRKAMNAEDVVPKVTVPGFGDDTADVAVRKFDVVEGAPGRIERRAAFRTGDVVAVVTTTAVKGDAGDVAIGQVLLLQAEMLR